MEEVLVNETYIGIKIEWCIKIPPRCRRPEIRTRLVSKLRTVPKVQTIEKCCAGYKYNITNCIPICTKQCIHGKCTLPEQCECDKGYEGLSCSVGKKYIKCLLQRIIITLIIILAQVTHKCSSCQNNSICDPKLGVCQCAPGWYGKECEIPCSKGYYGKNCNETCIGTNICDHVTGKNECRDGYIGENCDIPCPVNTYGKNCTQNCKCKNDALCNHVSGELFYLYNYSYIQCSTFNVGTLEF